MTGVRFELKGSDAVLAALADTLSKTDDKRGLFDAIGAALASSTQARFETETDPEGSPWPDSLRKLVNGGRTLTDSARLVQSLTHEATEESVAVGTNVIYAAIHQFGGTIKAKTSSGLRFRGPGNGGWVTKQSVEMPRRTFLGLDDDDEAEIGHLAAEWLGADDDSGGGDARL
ncbi:phage virion morphogenesis protein [Mesorhizobium australicum]|uniref:Phage virion morphogenesis (Putative tail completion) protein n=1 Tax=Mesorhizobium australicum TaxID=536018 RepID=A0A1X7NW62_9HYPH|nr:phage virion morphogenesis protein [Mesorhizobium australicum]SMH42492.1 phage virion morphogenesis (putative tail completion) protein [Mesorhizobium australicum]